MHAILFGMKRSFRSSVAVSEKILRGFRLTPARFDLLYAIKHGGECGIQSGIARALGVTTVTIGRMARSLEKLGLLRIEPLFYDKRQRHFALTDAGLALFKDILHTLRNFRVIARLIDDMFRIAARDPFPLIEDLESLLRIARRFCGDGATLHYPWHPDD